MAIRILLILVTSMVKYIIIRARSFEMLEAQVNEKISTGYTPMGGIIIYEQSTVGIALKHYAQAMIYQNREQS